MTKKENEKKEQQGGQAANKQDSPAKKRSGWKKTLLRVLVVIFAVFLLLLLLLWFFTSCRLGLFAHSNPFYTGPGDKAGRDLTLEIDNLSYRQNPDVMNILILGVDVPPPGTEKAEYGNQADTIMLLSINAKSKTVHLLPIPRDTFVTIPRYDFADRLAFEEEGPICFVYAYGDGALQSGQQMMAAVSRLLHDIPIHGYAAVDLEAVGAITDYVGGVPVHIYEDFTEIAGLAAGEYLLLDAEMAELYVRARSLALMDGSNLSRMVRQRQYLDALIGVIKQKTKQNLLFPFVLYSEMKPYLKTDLTLREIAYAGTSFLQSPGMEICVMDGQTINGDSDFDVKYFVNDAFILEYLKTVQLLPVQ